MFVVLPECLSLRTFNLTSGSEFLMEEHVKSDVYSNNVIDKTNIEQSVQNHLSR